VFAENFAVYGVRKIWRQMMREGFPIARCTVARLMREMGLAGVVRGKPIRTTISDKAATCALDHVNRRFYAPAPNMLWVADFTYVATRPPDWGPLELTETRLAPKMAPRFARCGEKSREQAGQMRCENPKISKVFLAFSGCCGKGGLERVKVFQ